MTLATVWQRENRQYSFCKLLIFIFILSSTFQLMAEEKRVTDPRTGLTYQQPVPRFDSKEHQQKSELLPESFTGIPWSAIHSPSDGIGITFPGPVWEDNSALIGFSFIPPDPHGAAGYDMVIAAVNVLVEARDKSGNLLWKDDLKDFFAPLGSITLGTFTFDPKVVFDPYEDRFVIITMEKTDSPDESRILLAVSKTASPATATAADWYYMGFDSKVLIDDFEHWADYPGFEVDEEAIYVTANMFPFTIGGVATRLWIIDKGVSGGFYDGGPASLTVHDPYENEGIASTTMPAQVYGAGGIPGGSGDIGTYLISYDGLTNGINELVQVVRVDDPLGNNGGPVFTYETVDVGNIDNTQLSVSLVPQPGASQQNQYLNGGDRRVYDAVWRNGALWAVTDVNPPDGSDAGQSTAHWFKLNTTGAPDNPVVLEDQGNIGGETLSPETHTFYPSVAVNNAGDAQFGFSAAGPNLYGGAYTTGRMANDSPGSTRPPETVAEGLDFYVRTFGGFRNRWGDYSGISVDPADSTQFWVFNLYAGTRAGTGNEDGRWETAWASATLPDQLPDPFMGVGPRNVALPNISIGDTLGFMVSIENFGSADLTISDISMPGLPFAIDLSALSNGGTLPISIPLLGIEEFRVEFRPTVPGGYSDSLKISGNDPNAPEIMVYFSGTASNPAALPQENIMYTSFSGAAPNFPTVLATVDPLNGTATTVGEIDGITADGIAINSQGEVFASSLGDLYQVDPATGTTTFFASIGVEFSFMDFGPNDLLYGLEFFFNGTSTEYVVHSYNLATGILETLGSIPDFLPGDIAYNPLDNKIYLSGGPFGSDTDFIYELNPANGELTEVGKVDIETPAGFIKIVNSLGFDGQGNGYGIVPIFSTGGLIENVFFSFDPATITPTIIRRIPPSELPLANGFASWKVILNGSHISLATPEIDFGTAAANWSSTPLNVTINSIGDQTLTISDISDPGGAFQVILDSLSGNLPLSIAPGNSETFHAIFTPSDSSAYAGSITITSDDPETPTVDVALNGQGSETPWNTLYGSNGMHNSTPDGDLFTLNPNSGAGSLVGNSGLPGTSALAVSTSGQIWAAELGSGDLYELNHVSGESRPAVTTTLTGISTMAFDGADNLYAISTEGPDYTLYHVDTNNGNATAIGATGDEFTGLAFDPTNGTLWGATGGNATQPDGIFTINTANASATLVGFTGQTSLGQSEGLLFDQAGNLYGIKDNGVVPGFLIAIDQANGSGSNIGLTGFRRIQGAAARLNRTVVGIADDAAEIPTEFALAQNYPNPFNPETEIRYALPQAERVTIEIFNVLGQKVRTLLSAQQNAGYYNVRWNGRDNNGRLAGSGLYIYRISAGSFVAARKMILLR